MKKINIIIFLFFILFVLNAGADSWDASFWGKSLSEVQQEINKNPPVYKMKLFNSSTLHVNGFHGVKLTEYKAGKHLYITFFDNKMVHEYYFKRYSDRAKNDLTYYYEQQYKQTSKKLSKHKPTQHLNKYGLTEYIWHLDNDIILELRIYPKQRTIKYYITSKEWRDFTKAYATKLRNRK